jgi:hypothetical protein
MFAVFELESAAFADEEKDDSNPADELLTPFPTPGCRLFDVGKGLIFWADAPAGDPGAKEFSNPTKEAPSPRISVTLPCCADRVPCGSKASEKSTANCFISLTSCGCGEMDCCRELFDRAEGDDDRFAGEFPAEFGENVILGEEVILAGGPDAEAT